MTRKELAEGQDSEAETDDEEWKVGRLLADLG